MERIKNYVIIPYEKKSYFVIFTPDAEFQSEIDSLNITENDRLIKNKLTKIFKIPISEFYSIASNKNFLKTYIETVHNIDVIAHSFYGIEYYISKRNLYKILSVIYFIIGVSSSLIFKLLNLPLEFLLYPAIIFGLLFLFCITRFIHYRDLLPTTLMAISNAERYMGRSVDDYSIEAKKVLLNKHFSKSEVNEYLNK